MKKFKVRNSMQKSAIKIEFLEQREIDMKNRLYRKFNIAIVEQLIYIYIKIRKKIIAPLSMAGMCHWTI